MFLPYPPSVRDLSATGLLILQKPGAPKMNRAALNRRVINGSCAVDLRWFWVVLTFCRITVYYRCINMTQSMKRYQVLVLSFLRNLPEKRWGQLLQKLFIFSS